MKRSSSLLAILAGFALTTSGAIAQEVDRIEVTPSTISIAAGDTLPLSIRAYDADGRLLPTPAVQGFVNPFSLGQVIEGNRFVAGAEAEGQLVLRGPNNAIARVTVVVTPPAAAAVEVGPLPESIVVGSVVPLRAAALNAAGERISDEASDFAWSTSDASIASVDALGNLVAHATGEVLVSATHRSAPAGLATEDEGQTGATARLAIEITPAPSGPLTINGPTELRTGQVGRFDVGGDAVRPRWFVNAGASIDAEGTLVADAPGTYLVTAVLGERIAEHAVTVEPRAVRRQLRVVGRGPVTDRLTGDLSVFTGNDGRDYAYLGTAESNAILVFDVSDPTGPVLTDSITTDARYVLDVKINADATLGVFSREGAATRANGITLIDLTDPAHPTVITEYTETVPGGVHNTFFEGDYIYVTHDGDGAMHVIDVSNPQNPREVSEWHTSTPDRYLHDLYVADGVAYLAYWQDGLVILDVGGAGKGGSPENPIFVGQLKYDAPSIYGPGGGGPRGTHSVYVEGDRAYVGDEVFPAVYAIDQPVEPRGYIHVVDISDLENPVEIARYEVPEAGAHNHIVEDGRLYSAYYQGGVRVVDVSGEVRGNLYSQGREVALYVTDASGDAYLENRAMAFGATRHKGNIFVSDMSSGLWVLEVTGEPRAQYPAE